ncbi:hypothetical protein M885DRAFT_459546 [Pelagophyceae sp. CCMP2097]|nr:hypothetical protein M885DRAFT_459546 [Pelagophyceae sp. CCMP2097]
MRLFVFFFALHPLVSAFQGRRICTKGGQTQRQSFVSELSDAAESHQRTPLETLRWAVAEYATRHNGSADVPDDFVVDESGNSDWPESLRGLKLGKAAAALRAIEALAVSGWRPAARDDDGELPYDDEDAAVFGLPRRPAETAAPRLSKTIFGRRLAEATGFEFGHADLAERRFHLLFAALKAYHTEHGDCVLPRNWRVPRRPPYPVSLGGMDLDRKVYNVDFYRDLVAGAPERQAALRGIGFVWQRLQPEFNLIVEALVVYKSLYGHLRVPKAFVVPAASSVWPVGVRGMPLGRRVCQIRSRFDYVGHDAARCSQLDGMGFVWQVAEHRAAVLDVALRCHAAIHGGAPAARFVVPGDGEDGAERWPADCRGLRLGGLAAKARYSGGAKVRQTAFEVVLDALRAYVGIHGHARVPQKFVVPCSSPWPPHCFDLPLGMRVAAIRSKGNYVGHGDLPATEEERRRRELLDDLDFEWSTRRYEAKLQLHNDKAKPFDQRGREAAEGREPAMA